MIDLFNYHRFNRCFIAFCIIKEETDFSVCLSHATPPFALAYTIALTIRFPSVLFEFALKHTFGVDSLLIGFDFYTTNINMSCHFAKHSSTIL